MMRWCMVPEIWCMTDATVISHFGLFFCPFIPLTAQKIKILKKILKIMEISSFYISVPKTMIRWSLVPGICCATDGQTDRGTDWWMDEQKKWYIEVGALPKNQIYFRKQYDQETE